MKDGSNELDPLATAGDAAGWWAAIEDIAERRGYFDPLGRQHAALFADRGPVLLVSFEEARAVRAGRAGRVPLGWDLTRDTGWSSLVLLSEGQSWFRDPEVFGYFDRVVDDAFFDEFDQVIFLGGGTCGHAAAAFSVAAPGATVIALAPQATLAPALAGWDRRFARARRRDFTTRYGYAPAMLEAAGRAFVIHDPAEREDAMHAALFAAGGVQVIRARHFGPEPGPILEQMGALAGMVDAAARGRLDAATIYRLLRLRRDSSAWLRRLLDELEAADRPGRVARLCRHVLARKRAPRFRRALELAEARRAAPAPAGPGHDPAMTPPHSGPAPR